MNGTTEFTITEADHLAALRRNFYDSLFRWRTGLGIAFFVAIYVLVFLGLPILDGKTLDFKRVLVAAITGPIVSVLFAGAILLFSRLMLPRRARRAYRQHRGLRDPIRAEWDDTTMRISAQTGESRMAWSDYVSWSEDAAVLILYHTDFLFNILPRAALSDAHHAQIVAALAAHGVPPRGRSRQT